VTTEETMKKYFENYGKIDDCVIMKEPKTSKYVNL
jgi:RNA recognition motif-containing protein